MPLTINTTGFSCPWDSGQVGIIYVTREKVLKEYGWKKLTAKRRQQIESYLRSEVETYDHYLTGYVHGFVVEKHDGIDWDAEDSCWGFYGGDAEGVHCYVAGYGFTLEQVKQAFADPWYDGADGSWVQTGEEQAP